MKKSALLLICIMGLSPILGADLTEERKLSVANKVLVDSLIRQIKSTEFDKNLPDVGEAYLFFNGQNIQNARNIHCALWFSDGKCSIETLYGLYLALQGFVSSEGERFFIPEDLNGGFTKDNYEFLKKIFEESV